MKIYRSIAELKQSPLPAGKRIIATLGLFDGVHLGHRHLIGACCAMAREMDAESMVITLDRHPLDVLRPDLPRPHTLCSLRQKVELIRRVGADHLLILPFDKALAGKSLTEFLQPIVESGLAGMMLGYDNRFGNDGSQYSQEEFDRRLRALGLEVRRVEPLESDGAAVSSSRIRALIAQNDLEATERLLGRPYSILGRVKSGRRIGRTLGFPTANIVPEDPRVTLPQEGVYITEVRLRDRVYPSMSYYGSTPTITPDGVPINRIEAYLFDFEGDLYGEELEVGFRKFVRGDQQFENLDALTRQLEKDAQTTVDFFKSHDLMMKEVEL
ncbi:MAG: riboflavin biosynthesis protein RibF [Porphyromonas sp.]|nr:riboflavin biosynthesis protein RibF [Porphyromonas sp.]